MAVGVPLIMNVLLDYGGDPGNRFLKNLVTTARGGIHHCSECFSIESTFSTKFNPTKATARRTKKSASKRASKIKH